MLPLFFDPSCYNVTIGAGSTIIEVNNLVDVAGGINQLYPGGAPHFGNGPYDKLAFGTFASFDAGAPQVMRLLLYCFAELGSRIQVSSEIALTIQSAPSPCEPDNDAFCYGTSVLWMNG